MGRYLSVEIQHNGFFDRTHANDIKPYIKGYLLFNVSGHKYRNLILQKQGGDVEFNTGLNNRFHKETRYIDL